MKKRGRYLIMVATLILTLALLFIYKYAQSRNHIFSYDVQRDYQYTFDNSNKLKLSIKDGQTSIPDTIDENYTAFLKLYLKSSFLGSWIQPSIDICSQDFCVTEYMEDGAEGYRYVNLSSLVEKGLRNFTLLGDKIEIEDQETELIFFEKENLKKSKILVVGTHPDDAEIAAYGLYSKYPKSFVLNIKAGESGEFKYDEVYTDTVEHYRKKGELRMWNSITIPLLGGIDHDNSLNLGFFANLNDMFDKNPKNLPTPFTKTSDIKTYRKQNFSILKDSLTGSSNWNSLIDNLEFLLRHIKPDVIVTPHPIMDAHEDHQYTTIAIIQALKRIGQKTGSLFLYSNHFALNEYFPYGKSGGTVSLPPNFNNDIYFKSIYSNSLNKLQQKDKLFALEANNDIRLDTEWRFGKKALKEAYMTAKGEIAQTDNSYFRRAVRSNELFFVVPIEDIHNEKVLTKIVGENR